MCGLSLPMESISLLLSWYQNNKRDLPWRKNPTPYHVWVSEIMLQQTRVEAVKNYYSSFLKIFPTVYDLANAKEEILLKQWEGLGYYNRVRNMQRAALQIVNEYGGIFPNSYPSLLKLKGVGPYTAAAISSICFSEYTPAIDGNVMRVISRLSAWDKNVDLPQAKNDLFHFLIPYMKMADPSSFTQAWMELGATVCLPNGTPLCEHCPLAHICRAHREGNELGYPIRSLKKPRKVENLTVFIFACADAYALEKRSEAGLLAGLWQFPYVEGFLPIEEAIAKAETLGVEPILVEKISHKTHIFTHKEWHMQGIYFQCAKQDQKFQWVDFEQRKSGYALPTAFRQFIED